jgi:acyl-CoA dehydrogenase
MDMYDLSDDERAIRDAVLELCARFPQDYWIKNDSAGAYPAEFVSALDKAGWLSVLIPSEYGGGGGTLRDAAIILETIERTGASALAAHAQMYTMGTILRHGSEEQKQRYLPAIAAGELRLQAFGVTEPDAGSDTTRISTRAATTTSSTARRSGPPDSRSPI